MEIVDKLLNATDQTLAIQYCLERQGKNILRDLKEILNYSPEAIILAKFISVFKFT